jgi:hypothetical protein
MSADGHAYRQAHAALPRAQALRAGTPEIRPDWDLSTRSGQAGTEFLTTEMQAIVKCLLLDSWMTPSHRARAICYHKHMNTNT